LLLWRTILEGKREGLGELDLGRSDYNTPGLIAFKDHWGAAKIPVNYYRSPAPAVHSEELADSAFVAAGKRLLTAAPDSMFSAIGGLLYRHVG
jgi:hypothetical protein